MMCDLRGCARHPTIKAKAVARAVACTCPMQARVNHFRGRHLAGAMAVVWLVISLTAGLVAVGSTQARAQSGEVLSNSYITPFPEGDVYALQVFGDTWAEGLTDSLRNALGDDARLRAATDRVRIKGLVASRWERDVAEAESKTNLNIAVVMLGAYDRASVRVAGRKRIRLGTEAWKEAYSQRVDRLMKAFRRNAIATYWIGQPITRGSKRRAHARLINEIVRERALRNRVKYIDTFNRFAGEDGSYQSYGADLEGKTRRLRWKDGLHFTRAGYDKIAHYVAQELRRDLRQARSERTIDLLGDVAQQRSIKRLARKQAKPLSTWSILISPFASQAPSTDQAQNTRRLTGLGAQTSTVKIPTGDDGKKVQIEIDRPAVAPAIVSLVTRRANSGKSAAVGEPVTLSAPDGLDAVATVMPASSETFNALSRSSVPTQMPIFKVWAKGERLPPRANRADDTQWPRAQTVVLVSQPQPEPDLLRDPLAKFAAIPLRPSWSGPPIPERNPTF